MMNSHRLVRFSCLLLLFIFSAAFAYGDDWKKSLGKSLKDMYALTKTGGWGGSDRNVIKEAGTVLVIQKEGIVGDKATDMTYTPTKVREGKVSQTSSLLNSKSNQYTFKPGDRVYLFDIDVKDSEIWFWFVSCDAYSITKGGDTRQTRYKGIVIYQFAKGYLETADLQKIKEEITSVLVTEDQAKAASTKTIELNQTFEQVEAVLGKPEKIVRLGSKTVYIYKDMKITFIEGKVTDVQ